MICPISDRRALTLENNPWLVITKFILRLHRDVTHRNIPLPDADLAADMYETMIQVCSGYCFIYVVNMSADFDHEVML